MQVTLTTEDDVKCVNWLAVAEQIGQHARREIQRTLERAGSELKELAPGERRKFLIEIGTVEISREADPTEA